jgi:LysM repeat protein
MRTRRVVMLIAIAALLIASQANVAAAAPQSSSNCVKYHLVQPGENLFRIGLQYGLTVEAVMQANGLYNPNLVYTGQSLCIPGNAPAAAPNPPPPACGVYYTVKWGDTLSSIAACYGVSLSAIMQANNITNANFVYAGMILKIPCGGSSGSVTYSQWKGEYFNNAELAGAPSFTRNDASIAFNWGLGWPNSKLAADNFSVRWTRTLYFKEGTFRFSVNVDDGARLFVDNVLVIDQWQTAGGTPYTVDVPLGTGSHALRLEYYEATGNAFAYLTWTRVYTPSPWPTPIPPPPPPPAVSSAWTGYYFGNQYLDDLKFTRIDPSIDFNWDIDSPGPGVPKDLWSARWISTQYFPSSGIYEFNAQVDDGVRIYVDNNFVVNDWFDHRGVSKGTINLAAGPHTVKVEYYDFGREAQITVWWAKK